MRISKKSIQKSKTRNSEGESHFKVVKEYYSKVHMISLNLRACKVKYHHLSIQ